MTQPKFCKDCANYHPAGAIYNLGWPSSCHYQGLLEEHRYDLETGVPLRLWPGLSLLEIRDDKEKCGPDARFFQDKPPTT